METETTTDIIYHGQIPCQGIYKSGAKKGETCKNMAYNLSSDGLYLCGLHSKNIEISKLPKNPNSKKEKEELLMSRVIACEEAASKNVEEGYCGMIIVNTMPWMKAPPYIDGYFNVFPNFKHGNRKDGYGCPGLSPKSLGPINHGMPNLPIAANLENFHQGAKFFPGEVNDEGWEKFEGNRNFFGTITPEALEVRKKMYEDTTPYRHKFEYPLFTGRKPDGNTNIQLFSIHYDQDGKERRYDYISSRYFYCYWYEKLAKEREEFKILQDLLFQGFNLQILGYDGYPVTQDLWDHYLDPTRPFGHELVLYTLLAIENPEDYPWNRYYRENNTLYAGVIDV